MKFSLNEEAMRANELSVGVPCEEQERLPLDLLNTRVVPSGRESERQVNPRGTLYFQMGRKVSMSQINHIIAQF